MKQTLFHCNTCFKADTVICLHQVFSAVGGGVLPHSKSWVRIQDLCRFSTLVFSQSKDTHGFGLTGDSTCECWPLVQGVACFSLYDS